MGRLEFFRLVKEMRQAQRDWFAYHRHADLQKSKALEERVDKYIANGDNYLQNSAPKQTSLFPET